MTGSAPEFQSFVDGLRRFAAMHDAFDPMTALREVAGEAAFEDKILMVELLSELRPDCSIEAGEEGDLWLMRPAARRKVLGRMDPETVAAKDQTVEAPSAFQAAVAGSGHFSPEAIDRLVTGPSDPTLLNEVAVTLDRAGPAAPGFGKLVAVRSVLNSLRQAQRTDVALAAGFFGRESELAALREWVNNAQEKTPLQTAHVSGLPGIGKSFLVERVIQLARQDLDPILVRLDFDRSSLQVLDRYAFFEEISRQVGDAVPGVALELRTLRLKSAEEAAALADTSTRSGFPRELLGAIGDAVGQSDRPMLIVLDTLEVLRGAGETHVKTLFDHLDLLLEFGVGRISVLSAGRGEALGPVADRIALSVPLRGLEEHAARDLLRRREVDEALWPRILPLARGNPLLLTLAAKAMHDTTFDATEVPEDASEEVVAGYLYRAILSRVPRALKGVANEGLILRRVNPETLMGIVAPALGLNLDAAAATKMLADLSQQHWLVEYEQGWIRHRPDIRSAILDLIYQTHRRSTAEIDRRAAEWFAATDPLSALYHRLQLTRSGVELPDVPQEIALEFTERMIDDLPPLARDAVLQARGQRSDFGRGEEMEGTAPETAEVSGRRVSLRDESATGRTQAQPPHVRYDPALQQIVFIALDQGESYPPPDDRAVRDLELMLEKNDLREASYVLANGFDMPFAADGPAAPVVMAHQWQTGQWSVVERMLRLATGRMLDRCIKDGPYFLGRIILEVWAEFRFDELVDRLDDPGFFEKVALLVRDSLHLGLIGGALEFALICAAPRDAPSDFFPTGLALLAPSMPDVPTEIAFDVLQRAESLRSSLGLSLEGVDSADPPLTGARLARALMSLNPYAAPIQAHVRSAMDGHGGVVLSFLDGLRPHLAEAAKRFVPDVLGMADLDDRLTSTPADAAQALAVMGLTAEWSDGFTFYRPVSDLPTIANAAERWRRTVNGLWSYGRRRPQGWIGVGEAGADWASSAHVARLMETDNPAMGAERLLRFWADPAGDSPQFGLAQARRRLLHRYLAVLEEGYESPDRALALLQMADVTGTLAVPLAVLAAFNAHPDTVLPRPDES
ncbi:hypothetical protein A8B78_04340 [Jannaschia sp. EhC01]|nr:hypothetical protein A8B78_04340 [Jannaschia sp. EhC01]